jgi:hypothetical protein
MKLDVPHGLRRLPPAPEFRRTQNIENTFQIEHISPYIHIAAKGRNQNELIERAI